MGNKDAGRAVANMPNPEYMAVMGANITDNLKNTGSSFTNFEVFKYFDMLREYALNRGKWLSPDIPEHELRLIEWNIFHRGYCAMINPKVRLKGGLYYLNSPKIYQCTFTDVNARTGRPYAITIQNIEGRNIILDINYNYGEFVIFTDDFINAQTNVPMCYITWEYANKMHELDLAFNANSHKNRMPFVFNNAAIHVDKDGTLNKVNTTNSIAELMRSAYGRNEQFVEISEDLVGKNSFMHEPQYVTNELQNHLDAQKKLLTAYFELLGLYTLKEKGGVYTVKDIQKSGDETGDYIVKCFKNTRLMCAKEACQKFGITLELEVVG